VKEEASEKEDKGRGMGKGVAEKGLKGEELVRLGSRGWR